MNGSQKNEGRNRNQNQKKDRSAVMALCLVVCLGMAASTALAQGYSYGDDWDYYSDPYWDFDYGYGYDDELGDYYQDSRQGSQVNTAAQSSARYHAVSVGIDNYASGTGTLPSCVNDANGLVSALRSDSARWGSADITVLTDADATKNGIRWALYNMGQAAQAGDVCVFFQSSHGGGGADMALITYEDSYWDFELGQDLADFFNPQVKIIVIVDACHAGGLFKSAAERATRAQAFQGFAQNAMAAYQNAQVAKGNASALNKATGTNVAFLAASDFDELSDAGPTYSAFAGKLIEAFRASDSDANRDSQLSFMEIFNWASPRTPGDQTPQAYNQSLLEQVVAVSKANGGTDIPCLTGGGACGTGCAAPSLLALGLVGGSSLRMRRRTRQF